MTHKPTDAAMAFAARCSYAIAVDDDFSVQTIAKAYDSDPVVKELVEAAKALLAGSERHIFGGECLTERDVMRAALAKIDGAT